MKFESFLHRYLSIFLRAACKALVVTYGEKDHLTLQRCPHTNKIWFVFNVFRDKNT